MNNNQMTPQEKQDYANLQQRKLMEAISGGYLGRIEKALKNGADINYFLGQPILEAIVSEKIESLKLLIEKGADVTLEDNKAITLALARKQYDMADLLLENKAIIQITHRIDPMIDAIFNQEIETIKYILKNSQSVNPYDVVYLLKVITKNDIDFLYLAEKEFSWKLSQHAAEVLTTILSNNSDRMLDEVIQRNMIADIDFKNNETCASSLFNLMEDKNLNAITGSIDEDLIHKQEKMLTNFIHSLNEEQLKDIIKAYCFQGEVEKIQKLNSIYLSKKLNDELSVNQGQYKSKI